MHTTRKRVLCYPTWAPGVPPMEAPPGWEVVTLWNLGNAQAGYDLSRPRPAGTALIDWEPPNPTPEAWTLLLRAHAKPGDIAMGVDPGVDWGNRTVQHDREVGIIAKVLSPHQVSMSYDLYHTLKMSEDSWGARTRYRLGRLNAVQEITGYHSFALVAGIDQNTPDPYGKPIPFSRRTLKMFARAIADSKVSAMVFAAASSYLARAVVDDVTRGLMAEIDAVWEQDQ